jgi:hypothetical protein
MEKHSGADLYISLVRRDGETPVSKGMLVQAKWDHAMRHSSERRRLRDQARQMLERTDDSYIWVYERTGVAVIPTIAFPLSPGTPLLWPRQTVGELLADGLKCTAGDRKIGRDLGQPLVSSLDTMLERLSAKSAIEFIVEPTG